MVPDVQVSFCLFPFLDHVVAVLHISSCRSRFQGGHTTEAPVPFINAPQQVLIEHCEQVHPRGWEILKTKVAEARAAEDAED